MAKSEFLWALGIATVLAGVLVMVMAIVRARRRATLGYLGGGDGIRRTARVVARPRAVPPPRRAARAPAEPPPLPLAALASFERRVLADGESEPPEPVDPDQPVEVDEADGAEAATKICPACGSRYASCYRVCTRDDNDLAALN